MKKKIILKKLMLYLIIFLSYININSFIITPLSTILEKHPEITYQKIYDEEPFKIAPFEIAPSFPYSGTFKELFVLTIPNGIVRGDYGNVLIDNSFIQELIWGDNILNLIPWHTQNITTQNIIQIPGKVLVLAQVGSLTYGHWLLEILGRLALIEMHNIEYDWIFIPYNKPFMKKILNLWGIDSSKIISPNGHDLSIEAETLLVPSLVIRTDIGHKQFGNFFHPKTLTYSTDKLLNSALQKNIDTNFSTRIFISKKDSQNSRKILNEDDVFKLFENKGFKRYELEKLSLVEQIILFYNAEIVISESGSGLTNILFCKPGTKVIELFHHFFPMDFWYTASFKKLNYIPVNLLDINAEFFKDCTQNQSRLDQAFNAQVNIPLEKIEKTIKDLNI